MILPSKSLSKTWTVAEAKARLSEVLRRAAEEGPQHIGTRKPFVVVPREAWEALNKKNDQRNAMGKWLVENLPRDLVLEPPDRNDDDRTIPFIDEVTD